MRKSLTLIIFITFLISCSKSEVDSNTKPLDPLDKQYKNLTSANVNDFFLESFKFSKGVGGTNFEFNFKNLKYTSEISRMSLIYQDPIVIWKFYTGDKEKVNSFGSYNEGLYALKYVLKDGRVLISDWVRFDFF